MLGKLAKKINMSEQFVCDVIIEHHLKQFVPEKQLVTLELDLEPKQIKWLEKVAKTLKVSSDSVMSYCLKNMVKSYDSK